MNYSRNMPDWQQYSTLQSGESDRQTVNNASIAQQQQQQQQQQVQTVQPGANSGGSTGSNHLFNLDCLTKSSPQNVEANNYYAHRANTSNVANSPLGPNTQSVSAPAMALHHHMATYNTSLGVMDDQRLAAAMGEDMQQQQQQQQQQQHRNVQISLNSPTSRMPSNNMTVNNAMGSMGQIVHAAPPPPSNPMAPTNRQSSYPCKGACCQTANIGYRWDKINPYQPSGPYRDSSMHPSGAPTYVAPPVDTRTSSRYRSDLYRKEPGIPVPNFPSLDHQQQQQQQQQRQRYRKETSQISRSYHQTILPPSNYPPTVQGYGFPSDYHHQKYYGRAVVPPQQTAQPMINPAAMAMQEKYLTKQTVQYQSSTNGTIMQNGVMVTNPTSNPPVPTGIPSPYFNPQLGRDLPGDYACKAPDSKDQDGRLIPPPMTSLQTKHFYQQKIQTLAMQRLNLEKHLRDFSSLVPAYQNHPKYQELLMKHRETIRLLQSLEYHQASAMQSSMQPINLQFDQNGLLVNSSIYSTTVQQNTMTNPHSPKETIGNPYDGKAMQAMEHALQQAQQQHHQLSSPTMIQPSPEQQHYLPQEYHHPRHPQHPHLQHPQHPQHPQQLQQRIDDEAANVEAQRQKVSKDFADKPELDVRQFLANWDETEEEDVMNGNLQNVLITEDTPIVVLEYEDLNEAGNNLSEKESTTPIQHQDETMKKSQITTPNNVSTVNIIRCITSNSETDDVPTIHIVDTIENEAVVKKIEGALQSFNSADIKSIEDLVNKNNTNSTDTIHGKDESISLSFLNSTNEVSTVLQSKETDVVTAVTIVKSPERLDAVNNAVTSPETLVNQQQSAINGKKPDDIIKPVTEVINNNPNPTNSTTTTDLNIVPTTYVNEDTRNNDDLSLPELPTSECTPISTTLNTPNHSDNEESTSERVRAMSISTNSMEIMPTSPIISFAHSPIKFQKSSTSDELQFDFQSSNEASISNSVGVKDTTNSTDVQPAVKDTIDKNAEESKTQILPLSDNLSVPEPPLQVQSEPSTNSIIDSAVFEFSEFSNSSSLQLGEEPKMPVPPMEGNLLTKIIKDTPPITNLRVLDSDDDLVDKVNDIWMDINLEAANLCANKQVTSEEKQVQTDKLRKVRKTNSLRHVRKNKSGVISIEKPKSKSSSTINIKNDEGIEKLFPISAKPLEKPRKSLDSIMKNAVVLDKPKKRAKSVELDDISIHDQEELMKEFKSLKKKKRSIGQIRDDIKMLKSSIDELRSLKTKSVSPTISECRDTTLPDTNRITKRRFSSIFDPPEKISKDEERNFIDSDIKIQLPNMNLQIKDKKETTLNSNNVATKEGIKIEINVSRVESQQDNEIINKSNQQLNISLPPSSPMSCKVDCHTSQTPKLMELPMITEKETILTTKEDNNALTFVNKNTDDKCLTVENKESEVVDKKETDIENALKKLEEYRKNSESDCIKNKNFTEIPGCSKDLDFDNFDVEPYDNKSDDYLKDLLLSIDGSKDRHHRKTVGFLNPLFHLDELENLNNVPVYTTKDGKITYSPNPNYTYRALIIEARQREGHALFRDFYDNKVNSKRNRRYSSSKSAKSYHRRRDTIPLSFENCITEDRNEDNQKFGETRISPIPLTPPHIVLNNESSSRSIPILEEEKEIKNVNRCIVDLQNLKDDILKKLNDQDSHCHFDAKVNKHGKNDKEEDDKNDKKILDDICDKDVSRIVDDDKLENEHVKSNDEIQIISETKTTEENPKEDNDKEINIDKEIRESLEKEFTDNDEVGTETFTTVEENEVDDKNTKTSECKEVKTDFIKDIISKDLTTTETEKSECKEPKKSEIEVSTESNEDKPSKSSEDNRKDLKVQELIAEEDVTKSPGKAIKSEEKVTEHVVDMEKGEITSQAESNGNETKIPKSVETLESQIPKSTETYRNQSPENIEEVTDEITSTIKMVEDNIQESIQLDGIEIQKPNEVIENGIMKSVKVDDFEMSESIENIENEILESKTVIQDKLPEITKTVGDKISKPGREVEEEILKTVKIEDGTSETTTPIEDEEYSRESKLSTEDYKLSEIVVPIAKTEIEESKPLFPVETNEKSSETETSLYSPKSKEISEPKSPEKPRSPPNLTIPCSIDKSNFSSTLCDKILSEERTIPKLVIRKTESNPKFFSKSKSIDDPALPKIPKMIIRNARSRPTTPSIEEISPPSWDNDSTKSLKVKIKLDEIPKMKIKLEEPRVPKMKITNVKSTQPKIMEKSLKRSNSSSPSSSSKRTKRSPRDDSVNFDPTFEDTQFSLENDYKQSTKVPKVIIKRASPSAEFKCELSRDAIVNAQPRVILNRSSVLDCMAKDLRHIKFVVKLSETKIQEKPVDSNELEWRRFISGLKKRSELSRSNSTPDLNRLSPKIKRRRTSDLCIGTIDYSDSESSNRFTFTKTTKIDENVNSPKIDTNLPTLTPLHPIVENPYWKSLDENMNHGNDSEKLETIIEASDSFNTEFNELETKENLTLAGDDSEVLDQELDVHEEEIDGTLDDFESSVIKVDSSDESQTTIEILPASPPNLDDVQVENVIDDEQIFSGDAIPMHFEYELEVGESNDDPLEVPLVSSENETDKSSSGEIRQIPGILISDQLVIEDTSGNTSLNEPIQEVVISDSDIVENPSPESKNSSSILCTEIITDQPVLKLIDEASSSSTSLNNIEMTNSHETTIISTTTEDDEDLTNLSASCSSSDLLVKEVLAAKQMIKKYLGSLSSVNLCNKSSIIKTEPDFTDADKEQSTSSFEMSNGGTIHNSSNYRHKDKRRSIGRGKSRTDHSHPVLPRCPNGNTTSTTTKHDTETKSSSRHRNLDSRRINTKSSSQKNQSHKLTKRTSKSQLDPLRRAVEENLRHSAKPREKDRENSRTPPVITNSDNNLSTDVVDNATKRIEDVISMSDDTLIKAKALQVSPEMTIAKIVQEFVFHEKATIRHRRYCMLCERWFPSSLRHRRHLAGYQHRHTELTQRRAIHMLFLIFTGKLCPKLLPPNVVRTDCLPGELTPLQIAMQDFATVFDGSQEKPNERSNTDKE